MGNEFTKSLIDRLHLKERFEQIRPISMEGKAILQKYDNLLERYGDMVSIFHNFLIESSNSNDDILKTFAKVQSNNITLNCPKSWHFGLIMEQLSTSKNPINEAIYDDLKYLLSYNESDLCEAISHGAFKHNMQIPGFKNLYESITGDTNARKLIEGSVIYNPISFVEIKNGKKYFMLENKIYEDDNDELVQTADAPSAEFTAANSVVQRLPYNPDVDGFVCNFLPAAVNVTSNGDIFKDKEPWDIQEVEAMVNQELEDKTLQDDVKIQESRKLDDLKALLECFPKLVKMDNITSVTNVVSGRTTHLFEGNKVNYIITNNGIAKTCKSLNEAMSVMTKFTGLNLRDRFEKKLNEELKAFHTIAKLSESFTKDANEAKKIIEQCNEEMKYCVEGSQKYNEFKSIKEDAEEYLKILNDTNKDLTL